MLAFLLFTACDGNYPDSGTVSPTEELKKVQDFPLGRHTVTAWNETGEWRLGYTKVYFTVTGSDGSPVEDAELSAFPEMDMGTMKHSAPRSEITQSKDRAGRYEAWYAFTMYSGQGDGTWYYDLKLTVGDGTDSINDIPIDVKNALRPDGKTERKVIQTLTSVDGANRRYVVTLVDPAKPKVGSNDITAYIHERIDANTYLPVERFTLKLDPRMPSMENHSSPHNEDLTWNDEERIYRGKLNLSMSGYWKLNLILQDRAGVTLYGNPVDAATEASSLYFELEF